MFSLAHYNNDKLKKKKKAYINAINPEIKPPNPTIPLFNLILNTFSINPEPSPAGNKSKRILIKLNRRFFIFLSICSISFFLLNL